MATTSPPVPDPLRFRKGFLLFMLASITLVFLYMIKGFLVALIMAAVFGALMRPIYNWLLGAVGERPLVASGLTLALALLVIIIPSIFLLGVLVEQAHSVIAKVGPWVSAQVSDNGSGPQPLPDWVPFRDQLEPYRATIGAKLAEFASAIGSFLVNSLSAATRGTASFFLSLFIMLYAMFFYLISGPERIRQALDFLPLTPADRDRILEVGRSVSQATLKGTVVIGVIQGLLGGISLAVAGISAPAFWGALMAVMSIIPGIGTFVIWGPIVAFLLFQGETPTALALLAWNALVVGSVDNVLRPTLVGKDAQMPDLLILLSTLGGLTLFGASGLVIGPVIAGLCMACWAIYGRVFREWLHPEPDVALTDAAPTPDPNDEPGPGP